MLSSVKHAFRVLRKDPGFTVIAIFSLAIGIGATSAMFSFADALLLRPLPVMKPDGVVAVTTSGSAAFGSNTAVSYPDYVDLRDRNRSFDGLLAASYGQFGFSPNPQALPRMKFGLFVSGNLFHVLGVEPALGRGFRSDEDQAEGRDAVVVLGHDFWVSQYNASPSVLGSHIRLSGIEYTVIGVAPEHFTGIDQYLRPALFVPLAMSPRMGQNNNLHKRDVRWLMVKGRLKPGVGLAQAQDDVALIAKELQKTYPQTNRDQRIRVETELQLRAEQSPPNAAMAVMLVLLGLCVLAVACANVAGLLLSRSRARSREIAIRLAIGAGRGSLVRQLLFENLLVAVAGGMGGVAVAYAGATFFNSLPFPSDLPIVFGFTIDRRVLLFTLVVSLVSTLLFGLAPALRSTRPELVRALKAADADSGDKKRFWGRNTIVAGQVALSLVLLVISAVLLQGFRDQLTHGPGFRTERLFLTSFETQLAHYSEDQTSQFYNNLLERTRSAPGVRSAALVSVIPMINGDSVDIVPEGYQLPRGQRALTTFDAYVSDGYFGTLGIPILQGRGFLESDQKGAPLVAVVNEHAAKHFWPKGDALGKRFHMQNASGDLVQIVGIAKTAKYFWIAEPPLDFFYLPFRQHARSGLALVTESNAPDAATIAPTVREVVRGLDPDMPVFDVRTMQDIYTLRAVRTPNMLTETVGALGLMGLILAIVGLYGLVAYSVSRRTREIGIRMAIGADRTTVVWMVLKQGLQLGVAGVAAGLVVSFFACSVLTSSLWIATFDHVNPLLYAAIGLPLLAITGLATWAPARRASRIDPMRALRDE
ncbi:MAG: ABC transporter permease [Bryobacteraceae bacterium]|jgi:predicted permease